MLRGLSCCVNAVLLIKGGSLVMASVGQYVSYLKVWQVPHGYVSPSGC